jgi:DNA-binding response OmpR family regulator
MLGGARILIVEDEVLIALDLADMVESAGATVVGPAPSTKEASRLLDAGPVEAAILDVNLADGEVTPVLERLVEEGTPVLVYSGGGLPEALRSRHPELTVLRKPVPSSRIVSELASLVRR